MRKRRVRWSWFFKNKKRRVSRTSSWGFTATFFWGRCTQNWPRERVLAHVWNVVHSKKTSHSEVYRYHNTYCTPGKGACDSGGLHSTFFGHAHWPNFFRCLWDSFGRSLRFGYSRLSLCANGYKRSQNVGTTSEFSVTRPLVKAGPMWKGVLKVPYYCSLNRPGSHPYTWPLEQILCFLRWSRGSCSARFATFKHRRARP